MLRTRIHNTACNILLIYLLGESDKVFVVGVHVRQLAVDQHHDLFLAGLLLLPERRMLDLDLQHFELVKVLGLISFVSEKIYKFSHLL